MGLAFFLLKWGLRGAAVGFASAILIIFVAVQFMKPPLYFSIDNYLVAGVIGGAVGIVVGVLGGVVQAFRQN